MNKCADFFVNVMGTLGTLCSKTAPPPSPYLDEILDTYLTLLNSYESQSC